MRLLVKVAIFGAKASLERLSSAAPIPSGRMDQVGTARKIPEKDSWSYSSQWFGIHADRIDDEVRSFLKAHEGIGRFLAERDPLITYALLTLCPVEQEEQERFGCLFSHETLDILARSKLSLEIAPAALMPDAPFWEPN